VISKPYCIGVYEVTQEEYEKIHGSNPSTFSAAGVRSGNVEGIDTKRFPVDAIYWNNAVNFCYRLSALPEEAKNGRRYRLPTEAEWEFACRAGQTGPDTMTFASKSIGRTKLVTESQENHFGVCGMRDSLLEWCTDWHAPYSKSRAVDPAGPIDGIQRIMRGAAWSDQPGRPQGAAVRGALSPGITINFEGGGVNGFRVVCDVKLPR
jgi:formylglycine-generating enzyme required for sulfatase activity